MEKEITIDDFKELIVDKNRGMFTITIDEEVKGIIDDMIKSGLYRSNMDYVRNLLVSHFIEMYKGDRVERLQNFVSDGYFDNIPYLLNGEGVNVPVYLKNKETSLIFKICQLYGFKYRTDFLRWLIHKDLISRNLIERKDERKTIQ